MINSIYVFICSKCNGPTIWETPYACEIWMLPCENCGYEYHNLISVRKYYRYSL